MFDVAIIGGGLAGCSAAITLAKQGFSVVVFEAKTYPHHKVCGEFLSPECAHILDELGVLSRLRAFQPTSISDVIISAADGTIWQSRFPAAALGISRYVLDEALANHAVSHGAELRQSTSVLGVTGSLDDTFTLDVRSPSATEQIRARVVIGAHGKRSSLDRALNRRFLRKPQPFVALKSHFYGLPLPNRIELHTFNGGYCGMSEVEGGKTNVCLLVREEVFQKAASNTVAPIPAFIQWMQSQNPHLRARLSQAQQIDDRWLSISQVPFTRKQVIENDILMAGDSAQLIAPLAGDGMAMALQTGQMAASHTSAFLNGTLSADLLRNDYTAAWKREFSTRLLLSQALQSVMIRPSPLALGLRLLNAIPPLGEFVIKHTRDTKPLHMTQQLY